MSSIFLDTHTLLWWTLDPDRLSKKVFKLLKQAEDDSTNIMVSSISLWEIGIKCKKNKLDLGIDIDEYVSKLELISNLTFISVSVSDWLQSINLNWSHKDHVDRIIVTQATNNKSKLLSIDKEISRFYKSTIW